MKRSDSSITPDADSEILPELPSVDAFDFSQKSRQSVVAIGLILIKLLQTLARQFWPFLLVIFFNKGGNSDTWFVGILVGLAVLASVRSIIRWFRFYFFIEGKDLVIEKGVFGKSRLNVPVDRVQTVNFTQSVLHQLFNVVKVEMDTAGTSGNEFVLQALSRSKAIALREYIQQHRRTTSATKKTKPDTETDADLPSVTTTTNGEFTKKELLLRLSIVDLIKIGVSQNHLRTAGVITVFFWSFLDDIEQAFDWKFMEEVEKWMGNGSTFWKTVLLILPFFLLVSFLWTLVTSVLRDYDYKFFKSQNAFHSSGGLFNKRDYAAKFTKIQLLRWTNNPLKRIFNINTLRLPQASSRGGVSRRATLVVPGIYQPDLEVIRQRWFPAWNHLISERNSISRLIVWRRVLYGGIVPALLLTAIFWWDLQWKALFFLSFILLRWWWADQYYKRYFYDVTTEGIFIHSGVITQTNTLTYWHKIQAVRIRQGLYQQRKSVADLVFYTAAGSVKIPYMPLEEAKMLRDFVVLKIEMDRREWM